LTGEFELPSRARLVDLFRPARLFAGLAMRPTFVAASLAVVLCVAAYTMIALGPAMPQLTASLLASSLWTESELTRVLRTFFLVLSFALPIAFVLVTSLASWTILALFRDRPPFLHVLSLVAHASLWMGAGFLAKALLVQLTGRPEPSVNLSFFVKNTGAAGSVLLAFTNPFLLLALAWTTRGLRAWGVGKAASVAGGAVPWAAWIAFLAIAGGGAGTRFAPSAPVSHENWETVEKETFSLRHPPGFASDVADLATILDGFSGQLAERFEFEPRHITIHAYPDHATLERATGEFLHVRVTGSVRGKDLLYLEIPGRNAAVAQETGLREAVRYVALMQLAPIVPAAPRWFVEGVAHAAAYPYSPALEREYVSVVRKTGVPTIDLLFRDDIYRTPEGPVLARSLTDFLAYEHGRDTPANILKDVKEGTSFRDALFSRTRLTTSELEAGWQQLVRTTLEAVGPGPGADSLVVPPDSAGAADSAATSLSPFRPRR